MSFQMASGGVRGGVRVRCLMGLIDYTVRLGVGK